MLRKLFVLSTFALIGAVMFGITALAYGLNIAITQKAIEAGNTGVWAFLSASRLVNIVLFMLVFVMVLATLLTIAERKWSAMMQNRIGPNRANLGPVRAAGLLHIVADAVKMIFKEDFQPKAAADTRVLFILGPILAFAPVFALFAVVPPAPAIPLIGVAGQIARKASGPMISLAVSEPDFGILYIFAIASLAVYGTALAGWASNNKFALLGGVRASSQMISYEVALGLSLVGLMMTFSTVQIGALTDGQSSYLWKGMVGGLDVGIPAWGILLQPIGFLGFFAAAFAETKRAPFDVPEGESEIIGYFVEYSGMKFGLFMISEFVEVVVLSAVITALFLGGYHLPFGGEALEKVTFMEVHPWLHGSILGLVFWTKVVVLCWVQLAIRWTFPRFRYDQIQTLGWKMLLPAGLLNVFITGALLLWGQGDVVQPSVPFVEDPSLRLLGIAGILELGLLAALTAKGGEHSHQAPARPAAHASAVH